MLETKINSIDESYLKKKKIEKIEFSVGNRLGVSYITGVAISKFY